MTWQPGQPIVSASDDAEWQAWRKAQKLEQQRYRRSVYSRIDYYPSDAALSVIMPLIGSHADRTYSAVIDRLITAAAGELPE
jgi:hypothetical protein